MNDKKISLIIFLLLVSGAISWNQYFKKYRQKDTVNISAFPKKIDSWTSEDLPISEADYEILETRNVFVRKYTNSKGQEAYLFLVYSQNNRKVSHPPEVCYTGGGVTISEHSLDTITVTSQNLLVEVNKLLLAKGNTKQVAIYWFKVGDSFTASYWKQQVLIALKTLARRPSSSALIRVSVTVADNNEAKAIAESKDFARRIIPEIFKYLP